MKRIVEREVSFCDTCKAEASGYQRCQRCKQDFCYGCAKMGLIKYSHAVHCSGSGDGEYCQPCDQDLRDLGDPLHAAYCAIMRLRKEAESWGEDFKQRCEAAEIRLKRLQAKGSADG